MFRAEVNAKNSTAYIPVTMDELMARFVTNMERTDCTDRFNSMNRVLQRESLAQVDEALIEQGVQGSMNALGDLLSNNTIDMERQPNSENQLYLKLMERAQEENRLKLVNVLSTKQCHVVKTQKPEHLRKKTTVD